MGKIKIIIAGIGGVGGYFGGLLAHHYLKSEHIKIYFLARGAHLESIQKNGLQIIHGNHTWTVRPTLATDNPAAIGHADVIIIASKSYDLELITEQLKVCMNQNTILLPLLNGVNNKERIQRIAPENLVLDGCVYIVSRLKEPGVVELMGSTQQLNFGLDNYSDQRLELLEQLLREANVDAHLSWDISTIIWEKYIFLSPIATATSYYDLCIGEILNHGEKTSLLLQLIEEVRQLALAKGIILSSDIVEKTISKLHALPPQATTSMHADFQAKKPNTELATLTGYVLDESKRYGLEMPTYDFVYRELNKRKL